MLNYFGQGALLLTDPGAAENPFYHLAPDWAHYPLVALATMATVIASQAVITGLVLPDPAGHPARLSAAHAGGPYLQPRARPDLCSLRQLGARRADARRRARVSDRQAGWQGPMAWPCRSTW